MSQGVLRRAVVTIAALVALLCAAGAAHARAAEFCPARIQSLAAVPQGAGSFAFRLEAPTARSVTGALLIETADSWYRVPFPPQRLADADGRYVSPLQKVVFPKAVQVRNVWLALAASDEPHWAQQGVVSCPPAPEREVPSGAAPTTTDGEQGLIARAIAPPVQARCAVPFADAVAEHAATRFEDLDVVGEAAVEVDIDANGHVVDTAILGNINEYSLRLASDARSLSFKPAVAYCKAVPSLYILRVRG